MLEKYVYNPEVLVEIAQDYLQAEEDLQTYTLNHNLSSSREEIEYLSRKKESVCTWLAMLKACRMVRADPDIVLATVKAMNRYERLKGWRICVHLPTGLSIGCSERGEDRVRRFFSLGDEWHGYFRSNGRRFRWLDKT